MTADGFSYYSFSPYIPRVLNPPSSGRPTSQLRHPGPLFLPWPRLLAPNMPIGKLPLEILDQIVQEAVPESYFQLVLTCKSFHRVCQRYSRRHRELRARFHDVDYHTPRHEQFLNAVDVLLAIAEDPIAGRYVINAIINADNACTVRLIAGDGPEVLPKKCRLENPDLLRKLIADSPYIAEAGIDPDGWMDKVLDPKGFEATVFLLTLLPNLVRLRVPSGWAKFPNDETAGPPPANGAVWDVLDVLVRQSDGSDPALANRDIWRLMDVIVKRANNNTILHASLRNLRHFEPPLLWADTAGDAGGNELTLTSIAPFLALPSLEYAFLTGVHACNGTQREVFHPRYPTFSPAMRSLTLDHSALKASAFADLLKRLPNLEFLCYMHEVKRYSCGRNCDIGTILAKIQRHAGRNLKTLNISGAANYYNQLGTTLADMSGFKVLEALQIDLAMLLGPAYIEGYPEWDGGYEHPGKRKRRFLKDILPPTVRALNLVTYELDKSLPKLLKMLRDFPVEGMRHCGLEIHPPKKYTWTIKAKEAIYHIKKLGVKVQVEGELDWDRRMSMRYYHHHMAFHAHFGHTPPEGDQEQQETEQEVDS